MAQRKKKKEAPPPVELFGDKRIARNKHASYEYELHDRTEAGMTDVATRIYFRGGRAKLEIALARVLRGDEDDMADVALKGGGEVKLVRLEGHRAALDSTSAAAPGTRLRYAIDGGRELCIKVHRCVRTGDRFAIEGRPIDLTRDLRQLLQRKLSGEA